MTTPATVDQILEGCQERVPWKGVGSRPLHTAMRSSEEKGGGNKEETGVKIILTVAEDGAVQNQGCCPRALPRYERPTGTSLQKASFHPIGRKFYPLLSSILHVLCLVAQSCPTLCNSTDCGLPGSSVHGSSRQEYYSGLPCPSPGDLPNPGMEPRYPALQADSLPAEPPEKPSILHKAYFQELLCGLGVRATCSYRRLASENCIFKDFLVLTFGKPPAHGSSPLSVLLASVHGAQPGRVLLTRAPAVATIPPCICWTAGFSVLRLLLQPLMPARPLYCLCCCPLMASATS